MRIKTIESNTTIHIVGDKITANKPIWILEIPKEVTSEYIQEYKAAFIEKRGRKKLTPKASAKDKRKSKFTKVQMMRVINKVKPDEILAEELGITDKNIKMNRWIWKKKFGIKKPIKNKKVSGRNKYTPEYKDSVVDKKKSDEKFASEMRVSIYKVQTYRSKWRKKGFGKQINPPTQGEQVKLMNRAKLKKDNEYMEKARKESIPEIKTEPCIGCGAPTEDPELRCPFCRQKEKKER